MRTTDSNDNVASTMGGGNPTTGGTTSSPTTPTPAKPKKSFWDTIKYFFGF